MTAARCADPDCGRLLTEPGASLRCRTAHHPRPRRPYAVDTYNGRGIPPAVVEVPDRNAQLAHIDGFADHHKAHACAVVWAGQGVVIAYRHDGTPHALAIGRTLSDQPNPYPYPTQLVERSKP